MRRYSYGIWLGGRSSHGGEYDRFLCNLTFVQTEAVLGEDKHQAFMPLYLLMANFSVHFASNTARLVGKRSTPQLAGARQDLSTKLRVSLLHRNAVRVSQADFTWKKRGDDLFFLPPDAGEVNKLLLHIPDSSIPRQRATRPALFAVPAEVSDSFPSDAAQVSPSATVSSLHESKATDIALDELPSSQHSTQNSDDETLAAGFQLFDSAAPDNQPVFGDPLSASMFLNLRCRWGRPFLPPPLTVFYHLTRLRLFLSQQL